MKFNNILVVYDPTSDTQPALDRAAAIARETYARLHIFACIYSEIDAADDKGARIKELISRQKRILADATIPLVEQGVQVETEVEWDKDWYHAVVRASVRHSADVVLKSSFKHSHGQRVLGKTSDWTLIRECHCPVLLVKEGSTSDMRKILAAIDVRRGNGARQKLNEHIVDFSKKLSDNQQAEVHFVNAFQELQAYPDRNALIRYCGAESDRIHIHLGDPEEVIVTSAKRLDAGLVIVGNSARSGLSAVIKGNTVEKVLDKLECDVLSMP